MEAMAELASDAEARPLLAAIRAGDRGAFTQVVAAHDTDLLRFAFVVSGDPDMASDAVQATWQRLWQQPPDLRDPANLKSWLLTVTANEARQARRRNRRRGVLESEDGSLPASRDPGSDIDRLDLAPALARLRVEDRELLALRYVVELTSPEIAVHFGITPEGVRTRLHRVLERLRRDLSDG
jgi:RNA polymerase sigma-70 factor (ECF subfamily)